jgi:hypothetical protein
MCIFMRYTESGHTLVVPSVDHLTMNNTKKLTN